MRKIIGSLLLGFSLNLSAINSTSLSDTIAYRELCYEAATTDEAFKTFKRDPIYRSVLENITYDQGVECLTYIKKKHPELISSWHEFAQNDQVGTPLVYYYPDLGGYASPTTLKYLAIAAEMQDLFGDLNGKRIIEVGGGYGGQCKVLSDIFAFESYLHVDLAEPIALMNKYLNHMEVPNVFFNTDEECQEEGCDLFISNFGFCQCNRNTQIEYMQKYILKSEAGYMILSNAREFVSPKPLSLMEIRRELLKQKYNVRLYAEEPCTNKKNILIVWKRK